MIEMFGNDAADKALARAGDYELKGESEGQRFWIQLAEMIQDILDQQQDDEPHTA